MTFFCIDLHIPPEALKNKFNDIIEVRIINDINGVVIKSFYLKIRECQIMDLKQND